MYIFFHSIPGSLEGTENKGILYWDLAKHLDLLAHQSYWLGWNLGEQEEDCAPHNAEGKSYWLEGSECCSSSRSNPGTNFAEIINYKLTEGRAASPHLEMLSARGLQEALHGLKEEYKRNCIKQSEGLCLWGPTNLAISTKQ